MIYNSPLQRIQNALEELQVVLFVGIVGFHGRWAMKQWAWRKGEIEKGTWDAVKGNNT